MGRSESAFRTIPGPSSIVRGVSTPAACPPGKCAASVRYFWSTCSSRSFAGSPECPTGLGIGVLAVLQEPHPVHEDMPHADRVLVWLLEGFAIGNRRRVEDHHVGEHAFLQE